MGLWISWDIVPLLSILIIHYKNFSSFENEEILFTEHSVDDNRDSFEAQFLFQDDEIGNNLLETSGIINLESSESDEESEEIDLNGDQLKKSIIS